MHTNYIMDTGWPSMKYDIKGACKRLTISSNQFPKQ